MFANEISSDLGEIHMRSGWDISSSVTRYLMRSDEILWDWMRLLHGRHCCRQQRLKRTSLNPSHSHAQPCESSVTLRKSLGNPVEKSGLRILVSRVGIESNFSRMLLSKEEIAADLNEKIC